MAADTEESQAAKIIPFYAYHDKPPYMIDKVQAQGEYYDLVRYLNEVGQEFQFELRYLPRNRVERLLEQNQLDGPVLGVNPLWFNDPNEEVYLWTSPVFFDQDVFVSRAVAPFDFAGVDSLHGKQACLVLGNYYLGVTESIQRGVLRKVATARESVILEMLDLGRCDFGIISLSLLRYFQEQHQWQGRYHVAQTPHDTFARRILVPRTQSALHHYLLQHLTQWPNHRAN
ncbi:substrate-binding periplasmic protein [Simiduia aestuariiviva]|uniref:Polar amino acid transport system substrate-binding protein n=1 Tax=Simiduia aestuariiviva TaxID=1510459 RepID=A0A839UKW7_9GAMM|nr:transporter substrate-binding domain-containing protein [Simiduia aestuariiviva]MBB3167411.1 polar amino acid transport system substrate-binding protein [Simiduia aestuariiviva]